MKREKLFTFLWSCLLSFTLSLGAAGCMVTAFRMDVNMGVVASLCAFVSVFFSACYSLPLGLLPLASVALVCGILWQRGNLVTSFEALIYRLSRQYDKAYDWGVIKLNFMTADELETHLWLAVTLLGVMVAMAIAWAVCHRKTAVPGCLLAVLMLSTCFLVTDTVPAVLWLFLFAFALLMLMLTGTVRRQSEQRGNRAGFYLIGPVALAILILLALIPPDNYKGTELPRKLMDKIMDSQTVTELIGPTGETGVVGSSVDSSTVNLTTVGVRLQSDAEILQLLSEYGGTIYLRGRALDRYDGKTWTDSGVSTKELYWPDAPRLAEGGEVMITTRYAHRMLYLPYYVQSRDMSEISRGLENKNKLTQYSFSCDVLSRDNDFYKIYTRSAYEPEQWDLEFARYLHLEDSVWQWAEPLATEITRDEESVYGKAYAIGEYVRNSATYSLNTHRMPASGSDFAKWFLEDSDTGYCVHFATTATVLLQAAGIPARYVSGYMVDVKESQPRTVRAKDAHAWAEYWLPGFGWMILEATPPDLTGEEVTAPQGGAMPTVGTVPTLPEENTGTEPDSPATTRNPLQLGWIGYALMGLSAVCVLIGQWQLRICLQRKKLDRGDPNARILHRWVLLCRYLRHAGQLPEQAIYTLAEKAKFSRHVATEEEIALMDGALEAARGLLKKRSVFLRLYYRLILALY